jgi:hypothetical protein
VTVAAFQQNLRVHSFLHHAGRSPFAADHAVECQMSPEIVRQELRTAIQLPFPQDIKTIVIHDENSTRTRRHQSLPMRWQRFRPDRSGLYAVMCIPFARLTFPAR